MTLHIRALIDALPLAELTLPQLDAAERHARDCTPCSDALAAAKDLDSQLNRLAEPSLPAGFAAAVLLRAAHLDEERAAASREASPAPAAKANSDRFTWAAVLAGLAIALGTQMYGFFAGEATFRLTSSLVKADGTGLIEMPQAEPAVAVLAAGLLLYLAGMFASVRPSNNGRRF